MKPLTFTPREMIAWVIAILMLGTTSALLIRCWKQDEVMSRLITSFDSMYTNTVITIKR